MHYLPHTAQDVRDMLDAIGVASNEELFVEIPEKLRLRRPLQLDSPLSEPELAREMERLAGNAATPGNTLSFLGGGAYPHFIPAAIDQLVLRSEFTTAYTPYQPEISVITSYSIHYTKLYDPGLRRGDPVDLQQFAEAGDRRAQFPVSRQCTPLRTVRGEVLAVRRLHPQRNRRDLPGDDLRQGAAQRPLRRHGRR